MGNWVNWLLVILGLLCVIVELALGALTGFDMALIGAALAAGGICGLLTSSYSVGLALAAGFALAYLVVFRSWLKAKLNVRSQTSNVDAILGKTAVVTQRIAPGDAGIVKVGSEQWRAELTDSGDGAKDVGATVRVESVEGVTLKVK